LQVYISHSTSASFLQEQDACFNQYHTFVRSVPWSDSMSEKSIFLPTRTCEIISVTVKYNRTLGIHDQGPPPAPS
jgi:hypothetical protein